MPAAVGNQGHKREENLSVLQDDAFNAYMHLEEIEFISIRGSKLYALYGIISHDIVECGRDKKHVAFDVIDLSPLTPV